MSAKLMSVAVLALLGVTGTASRDTQSELPNSAQVDWITQNNSGGLWG